MITPEPCDDAQDRFGTVNTGPQASAVNSNTGIFRVLEKHELEPEATLFSH